MRTALWFALFGIVVALVASIVVGVTAGCIGAAICTGVLYGVVRLEGRDIDLAAPRCRRYGPPIAHTPQVDADELAAA